MEVKKKLAIEITTELHSKEAAEKAAEHFAKTVQDKERPEDIPTIELFAENQTIADVLVETGLAGSKSDAKRLIDQGGVKVNNDVANNALQAFQELFKDKEALVQVGKRKFVKIKLKV
jgi:tyrosyl-tRNA synthetase